LLRHYPGEFHMNTIADREDAADHSLSIKVFGKSWS
jgi:hypothetical protein